MTNYRIMEVVSPGLVGVTSEYGGQLMTERTLRKNTRCETCREPLAKGSRAFGPVGNGMNRMHRIHARCLSAL